MKIIVAYCLSFAARAYIRNMGMQEARRADRLNFFLLWGSLLLAFLFPFELFLFSYAVLGPLHYMTEINWLDKKNYFLRDENQKKNYVTLSIAVIGLLALAFFLNELGKWDATRSLHDRLFTTPLASFSRWGYSLLFAGFMTAVVFHLAQDRRTRLLFISLAMLLTLVFYRYPAFSTWVGMFLPTIIHVFLFTFFFMWAGTLRNRSAWGYANLLSMGAALWIIIAAGVHPVVNSVSPGTVQTFIASNFHSVNFTIGRTFSSLQGNHLEIYSSVTWKIQVFLAFAYTYHYLNWFSKTSVIQWHQVKRRKMRMALLFWLAAVGLYAFDYRVGFLALFVLSMLHVILEFPLNVNTLHAVWNSIRPAKSQAR